MTSIVRVGQSHFAAIPIDEDSRERIMNCIETLANLQTAEAASEIFLKDTRAAYTKMVANEEVRGISDFLAEFTDDLVPSEQKKAREKKAKDTKKTVIQADDLIPFRQFAKKTQTDGDDVSQNLKATRLDVLRAVDTTCFQVEADLSRATGSTEVRDDFISKLSRMMQLTGKSRSETDVKIDGH